MSSSSSSASSSSSCYFVVIVTIPVVKTTFIVKGIRENGPITTREEFDFPLIVGTLLKRVEGVKGVYMVALDLKLNESLILESVTIPDKYMDSLRPIGSGLTLENTARVTSIINNIIEYYNVQDKKTQPEYLETSEMVKSQTALINAIIHRWKESTCAIAGGRRRPKKSRRTRSTRKRRQTRSK